MTGTVATFKISLIIGVNSIGPKEQLTPNTSTFNPSKTLTIVIGSQPDKVLKLLSNVIVTKTGKLLFSLTAKIPALAS